MWVSISKGLKHLNTVITIFPAAIRRTRSLEGKAGSLTWQVLQIRKVWIVSEVWQVSGAWRVPLVWQVWKVSEVCEVWTVGEV